MLRLLVDGALAFLFAPPCAACGLPIESPHASAACDACWAGVTTFVPPLCAACGDPLISWRDTTGSGRCPACHASGSPIALARSIGPYDGPLRELLHALKYDGRRTLAARIATLMRRCGEAALDGADAVVPVPLHWRRRIRRGFNQSALLASHLGPPILHALRRTRHTRSQTDLPADTRRQNVRKAFRVARGVCVRGAVLTLIDDVRTTGATLDACAEVLLEGGAKEVRALTAARVPAGRPPRRPR